MQTAARRALSSAFAIWVIFALFGIYYLIPLKKRIKFGMDLVGGAYLSLRVDTDKAIEDELYERLEGLMTELKLVQLDTLVTPKIQNQTIILTAPDAAAAREVFSQLQGRGSVELKQVDNTIQATISEQEKNRIKHWAVESNIKVLTNRLDKFALGELNIAAQGDRNIIIELPDVENPEQAKAMIGKAAMLEFKLVKDHAMTKEDLLDRYDGQVPDGTLIVSGRAGRGTSAHREYYLVSRHSEVTGKYLRDAFPDFDPQQGGMLVSFRLSNEGGKRFHTLTSRNLGQVLAVIIDDEVVTAATINSPISDAGSITQPGGFPQENAKDLALLLKSGAYSAPVKFEEDRHIGASLGEKAVRQGLLACLVSLTLLFLFSVIYYRTCGLLAFITLLYNLILVLLALAWFKGTLTLPGIAGMVLTIGMAIDASILIFERIKEELAMGVTFKKAVDNGFAEALSVILDSNITHLIVGLVLLKFGTGSIQGFAITLIIGIVSTLITGLFFLRAMFSFILDTMGVKSLKI